MMNDGHLDHLISEHLHGTLTPEQRDDLESRLLQTAADRQRFWEEVELHAMLHEVAQRQIGEETAGLDKSSGHRSPQFSWRPFWAAAAGLVVGLFSATLVWAIAAPKAMVTVERLFGLVDGGFESTYGRIAERFPTTVGEWSGDAAEIVPTGWLRFIEPGHDVDAGTEPDRAPQACDVFQVVDLGGSEPASIVEGEGMLELSASFLDSRAEPDAELQFVVNVMLFEENPAAIPGFWPSLNRRAVSMGSGRLVSGGGGASPGNWKRIAARCILPPHGRYAVAWLSVHRPDNSSAEAEFGPIFADDVRLELKTLPVLPVRVAQR